MNIFSFKKSSTVLLCLLFIVSLFGQTVNAQEGALSFDAALVQARGDSKVYYIQNALKRWISSEQAFLAQGFKWSDIVTIDPTQLVVFPDGAEINTSVNLGLSQQGLMLPDLAPVAPYDIHLAVENGRTRLRFTATFWNRGLSAFQLDAQGEDASGDREFSASQKINRTDGSTSDRPVGTLFWHEIHQHYHYDDFGTYVLEMVRPVNAVNPITPVVTSKTTFCMRDDLAVKVLSEGVKQPKTYTGCTGRRQGVSIGWADVYPSTLPDQFFDVTDLPAGIYKLAFQVDPLMRFAEMRRDNNVSMTFIDIDPAKRTVRVIGTASAYESPSNNFADGSLVRAEGDTRVYVVTHNKKRWIRNDAVFNSYGFGSKPVYTLARRALDMIPPEILVRVTGTAGVYFVNVDGFKRKILNPEILASYGWSGANVTDINQTEFDSLPATDLVARVGDDRVFSISGKQLIGTFEQLRNFGLDSNSVHGVTEKDFQALIGTTTVAQNLMIPWDVGFLPDGDMIVTERTGTLRRIGKQNGTMEVPGVLKGGEGGLMGLAVDPSFSTNQYIYLYYTTDEGGKKNRVTRFRLNGTTLILDNIILDGIPSAIYHDGGQVDFGPDGKLYIATGDATQPNLAQDTASLAGKILRINSNGSIPSDNPFGNAVWSYGHRNPQGFTWDNKGRMYAAEHGPTGELGLCCRDEVNRIEKGGNYGWPVITGDQARAGMITPLLNSGASKAWAPSGIAYAGGKLYFTGLIGASLFQATIMENGGLTNLRTVISGTYGRIRASVLGPDGMLYLTTSNRDGRGTVRAGDDKVLRVSPDTF